MRVANHQTNISHVVFDLLKKGIPTWRSLDAYSSQPDLIILHPSEGMLMVKVRAGYRRPKGNLYWNKGLKDDTDLYAVVIGDEIHYVSWKGDPIEMN